MKKKELLDNAKSTKIYKSVLEKFPDAELINIEIKKEDNND